MIRKLAAALLAGFFVAAAAQAAFIITAGSNSARNAVGANGYIVFASATCARDENGAAHVGCSRHRRIFSEATSEEASVEVTVDSATTCPPTAYSFADPVLSEWTAGTEGNREFQIATGEVASDCNLVLKFQNLNNVSPYTERQTTTITIVNTPPGVAPAQTYYISDADGSDSDDGLTEATAWLTLGRANSVTAHEDGDVQILIDAGTYTAAEHIRPANGGTDWDHEIAYCANGGDVILDGTGQLFTNTFENGVAFVSVNGPDCPNAADDIILDGGCTFAKDSDFSGTCGIVRGTEVDGQDLKLCYTHRNTYGYPGFNIDGGTADRVTFCGDLDLHGAPDHDELIDPDTGDAFYFNESTPSSDRFLVDGGTTGIDLTRSGHVIIEGQGGSVTVRNARMANLWNGVANFAATDGNRAAVFNGRSAADWVVHDVLVNRTGKAPDSPYQESFKCEGRRTAIFDSVFRNAHAYFMLAASEIGSSWFAEDCFVSHSVFDNGGALAYIEDYCDDDAGLRRAHGYKFKNIVAKNVANASTNPFNSNALFVILSRCGDSYPMTSALLEVDGLSVQDSNCARLGVYVYPSPGFVSMATAISTWPDMFKNYTCSSDLDLDNAPANGTDLTLSNMVTAYTPVADTESVDQGVALTTANGAGSSSTSLAVHNGCAFPDPVWGTPGRGQSSAGYRLHIAGVGNVSITAKTYTGTMGTSTACRATFTISPASTWADGAAVNFPYSGTAPDRGISH